MPEQRRHRTPFPTATSIAAPGPTRAAMPRLALSRPTDRFVLLLGALVLADLVFLAIHVAQETVPGVDDIMFNLSEDRSHAEFFNYIKCVWLGAAMLGCTWLTRSLRYLPWAVLFGYFLLDDAFGVHEKMGTALTDGLGLPDVLGLRGQDLGELLFFALAGLVVVGCLVLAWRGAPAHWRAVSREFAILIVALGVVGVGFDLVHAMADGVGLTGSAAVFGTLEDFGEMVVVSLMAWRGFEALEDLRRPVSGVASLPARALVDA